MINKKDASCLYDDKINSFYSDSDNKMDIFMYTREI
jgi:hypothetical protein